MEPAHSLRFWLIYLAAIAAAVGYTSFNLGPEGTDFSATVAAISMSVLISVGILRLLFTSAVRRLAVPFGIAQRFRPGAVVVPGFTSAEMADVSRRAGWGMAGGKGYNGGGRPIAVVSLPDRIEVWSGRNSQPRLTFMRAQIHAIGVSQGYYSYRKRPCVSVSDATGIVLIFIPNYKPSLVFSKAVGEMNLQRAVYDLTRPIPPVGFMEERAGASGWRIS